MGMESVAGRWGLSAAHQERLGPVLPWTCDRTSGFQADENLERRQESNFRWIFAASDCQFRVLVAGSGTGEPRQVRTAVSWNFQTFNRPIAYAAEAADST